MKLQSRDKPSCEEWDKGWRTEFNNICSDHNLTLNNNPCDCSTYLYCSNYDSYPCSTDDPLLVLNPCTGGCEYPQNFNCGFQMTACSCDYPVPRCIYGLKPTARPTSTTSTTTTTTTTTPTSWLLSTTSEPGGGGGSEEENTWWHWVLIAVIAVAFVVLLLVFLAWRRKRK